MSARPKSFLKKGQKQHEILVPKAKLTSKNLGPTSEELFQLMHLTSCDHAIERWKDDWIICPVCSQPQEFSVDACGVVSRHMHKSRKEILQ